MSKDLVTMPDFKEALKDSVREKFANLIPEEALEKYVSSEVEKFEKEELPKIISQELEKKARELISETLTQYQTSNDMFGDWRQVTHPILKEAMVDAAPRMFAQIMESFVSVAFNNMRNSSY